MTKVADDVTIGQLVYRAARALSRAGLDHRIDIYRDVEVDDPAVLHMLGQKHRMRVRIRITASSLLDAQEPASAAVKESRLRGRHA